MSKRPRNSVGPWAKEKLDALGQYLGFYTKVLKNQRHWCKGTIYVDAFAGPGIARVRAKETPAASETANLFGDADPTSDPEAVEFLKGSPRVALDMADPFTRYVFIERNSARVAELRALAAEYGGTRKARSARATRARNS
jgi:three-Cys-motif partner protein